MKKFIIRADIEGVSGIVSAEQTEPGKPDFAYGLKMFHSDLKAVLDGLFTGGASSVTIYDMHYFGRNVDISVLPRNTAVVCGKPPYNHADAGGLDSTCSGLVLLGFHSKHGTDQGLLAHTYEPDITDVRLNGLSVGEIGIDAAVAGDFGVPLVLFTGDSAGAAEAKALVPETVTAVVKESLGRSAGLCYSLEKTRLDLQEKARYAAENCDSAACFRVAGRPVVLEVDLAPKQFLAEFTNLYPGHVQGRGTVRIEGASVVEVWSEYLVRKVKCYDALGGVR